MDRLAYIGMSSASTALDRQAVQSNNLSNASTPGFRAQLDAMRAVPVQGQSRLATRAFVAESTPYSRMSAGTTEYTGRTLDIALQGNAWLAVQSTSGQEAYTRRGDLQVNAEGVLVTGNGLPVLGEGGPLTIPPGAEISVSDDGTISVIDLGQEADNLLPIGKMKLVEGNPQQMIRRPDGLFGAPTGAPLPSSPTAKLAAGAIEGSNMNVVEGMVAMISATRLFDFSTKMIQTAQENDKSADSLLSLRG